jgi:hypothetical protein
MTVLQDKSVHLLDALQLLLLCVWTLRYLEPKTLPLSYIL